MSKHEINVVLIGETGSGKSTFINYLVNYFYRGSLNSLRVAIPTAYIRANMNYISQENAVADRTKSKTVECQRYSFEIQGQRFNFIDTPGTNDTNGRVQDVQNIEKVLAYIQSLNTITAIVLILNGTVARATINIKMLLTYIAHTVNFSPKDIDLPEKCPVYHMQNSAFASDPRTWSHNKVAFLQRQFDTSIETLNQFLEKLLSLQPTSTKLFENMNDARNKIKQQLYRVRMTILDLQTLEDELAASEVSGEIHATNASKFQKFLMERTINQTKQINTSYYNTRCFVCDIECHRNCKLNEAPLPGSTELRHCSVMNSLGYCRHCPNRCHASKHFHARYSVEIVKTPAKEFLDSMQQRYFEARQEQQQADLKCDDLEKTKRLLERELGQQYKEIKEEISSLKEMCNELNITEILFQFIELLQKDNMHLKSPSVIRKSGAFIDDLKQLCANSDQSTSQKSNKWSASSFSQKNTSKLMMNTSSAYSADLSNSYMSTVALLPHGQTTDIFHSSGSVYPQLPYRCSLENNKKSTHNEYIKAPEDMCHGEKNENDVEQTFHSIGMDAEEKIPQQQIMPDGHCIMDSKAKKEHLSMQSFGNLIHLLNNATNELDMKEIKDELQRRCFGESVGFLTFHEQIMLCEQYAKHQNIPFPYLMRLSVQLIDEIEKLTGDDPIKMNCLSSDKRLQLAAINLLIKNRT
ncbi:hypothetical protein I4U23_003543 [Adineta vaga]|nr:hypothetical protein I4U23_003543 [Adineta vaga]